MRQQSPIPARASRTQDYSPPVDDEDEIPDSYYPQRMPSNTKRYVDTRGNQVIQQGNRRIVIHEEPPPKPKPKVHWLLILGIGMVLMLMLYVGFNWVDTWWTEHQLDGTYGFPRTYQTDAVVYQGDSADHPSHYIFLNLNGTVQIIELPHGDSGKARIYKGPAIVSNNANLVPVTGEFKQANGKVEMIVHIGNQEIIYVNNGQKFIPQQQE